jgi:hypothetical protein
MGPTGYRDARRSLCAKLIRSGKQQRLVFYRRGSSAYLRLPCSIKDANVPENQIYRLPTANRLAIAIACGPLAHDGGGKPQQYA